MYQLLAVAGGLVEPAVLMKLLVQYCSICPKKVQYEGTWKTKIKHQLFSNIICTNILKTIRH